MEDRLELGKQPVIWREKRGWLPAGCPRQSSACLSLRLLREALGHMLAKKGNIEVTAWSRLCHCGRNR